MFGVDSFELIVIAVVALVVIGPRELPRAMRMVGHWAGRARGMARHFRSGIDTMMREAELEEMEKKWREDNDRILRDHPMEAQPGTIDPEWQQTGLDQSYPPAAPVPAAKVPAKKRRRPAKAPRPPRKAS